MNRKDLFEFLRESDPVYAIIENEVDCAVIEDASLKQLAYRVKEVVGEYLDCLDELGFYEDFENDTEDAG